LIELVTFPPLSSVTIDVASLILKTEAGRVKDKLPQESSQENNVPMNSNQTLKVIKEGIEEGLNTIAMSLRALTGRMLLLLMVIYCMTSFISDSSFFSGFRPSSIPSFITFSPYRTAFLYKQYAQTGV